MPITEDDLKDIERNAKYGTSPGTTQALVDEIRRLRACKAYTFVDKKQVPCDLLTGHDGPHVYAGVPYPTFRRST